MKQEIYYFLQNPSLLASKDINERPLSKVQTVFKVYLLCMSLVLVSGFFILITDWIVGRTLNFSIQKNLRLNMSDFYNYWGKSAWVLVVILAPVLEEMIFRLPLSNDKRLFALSIGFATYFFTGRVDIIDVASIPLWRVIACILVALSCYFLLTDKLFLFIREKFFNYACWGLIVAFSWMHIGNFAPLNWSIIFLYPIYVLPQLFYGIGASFLMVKYKNIVWPILLHMLINGVAVLLRSIF